MGVEKKFTPNQAFDVAKAMHQNAVPPPEWEAVVPLGQHTLPPFPLDALPTWLRAFAEAVTAQCETPPDLAGVLVLSVVAAAVAGKAEISPRPQWYEPLNLFCIVALPPGSRKSAVFKLVTRPLIEYERAENERLKPIIAQRESERRILKAQLDAAESAAAKAKTPDDRLELEDKAKHLVEQLAALKVPGMLRLFTDDCTLERLAGLMSEQDGRIAVLSAEGGLFGTLAGRYNDKGANIDAVLKGHSGDALRVDRVGRPAEYIDNPCLTLGLAVQPDVLEGLAAVPGFRGKGLLARFLYSLPEYQLGYDPLKNPPIPPLVQQAYHVHSAQLLDWEVPKDENDVAQCTLLTLAPEAEDSFQEFRVCIEGELRLGNALHDLPDWGRKMAGAVARLAGILHLAEHGETNHTVSLESLRGAVKLAKYFMQHALAAFDLMGADPETEDARFILKWIERTRPAQFTQRDAHNTLQGRFKRVDTLHRALAILTERHYVRPVDTESRSGPGRKPSTVYEVNPSLHNLHNLHNKQEGGIL